MGSPKKKGLFKKPSSHPAAPSGGGFPVALSFSDDGTSFHFFLSLCADVDVFVAFVKFLFTMLPMASNSMGQDCPNFDRCLCFGRVSMICLPMPLSPSVTRSLRSLRRTRLQPTQPSCSMFFLSCCWPKRSTMKTIMISSIFIFTTSRSHLARLFHVLVVFKYAIAL